jgi:hypothetical protein
MFHLADFCLSGPWAHIPDQPLHSTNIGWYPELVDPVEASANRSQAPGDIDEPHGLREKAAREMW